jgi:ATP-dependent DNA helicase RecQ
LDALLGFCETAVCRRKALLSYFGEDYSPPCNNCDNCLEPVDTWDGKIAAQKALSCVYRTGQRFGVKHLIDVLLGKETPQILRFGHHKLSTFNIGNEYSQAQWQSIYRQLIAANLLSIDMEGYGGLRLTENSFPLLRGECTISLRKEHAKVSKKRKAVILASNKATAKTAIIGQVPIDTNDPLWQALKSKRLELARAQGVPPYIIFHDITLQDIYHKKPKTVMEFAHIFGVGQRKLEQYAQAFIDVINA